MGCTVREKVIRANRKKPIANASNYHANLENMKTLMTSVMINESKSQNLPSNLNPNFDDSGWSYCTEEQLEEILLKNLDFLYNEAISKLIGLGYDAETALRAVLKNGYCYGSMNVLTNVLHNSLTYLNRGGVGSSSVNIEESEVGFVNLRELEEYSIAAMVCLLRQVKPYLTRGDAMWCLLMSDLHVGHARAMEIPKPPLCGGSDFPVDEFLSYAEESCLQREIECPKGFNLSPSMKSLLKKNVAALAAGVKSNVESEPLDVKSLDGVSSLSSKFDGLNLNLEEEVENIPEDEKGGMIMSLVGKIKDLERQVKERKEWAQQKAMQAARKLSNDLTELKTLRLEREENQRLKKGKQTLEDSTLKRVSEMESACRKANGQVDRVNAVARRLESENAEIRAEMEASKLSASESVAACLEVAKREKKCLKRLLAWEKQKAKMQEELAAQRERVSEKQQQLVKIQAALKEAEEKLKQEQKAKESALFQLEEEERLKEAAEATNKRRLETLRLKTDIDFQRHKDDLLRLEHELSRLKASTLSPLSSDSVSFTNTEGARLQGETVARLLHEFDKWEDSAVRESNERECLFCTNEEVSVLFLPCAHQVLCSSCNDSYGKKGRETCPCCHVLIEQRIRVFGPSS